MKERGAGGSGVSLKNPAALPPLAEARWAVLDTFIPPYFVRRTEAGPRSSRIVSIYRYSSPGLRNRRFRERRSRADAVPVLAANRAGATRAGG